eukprot:gene10635-3258_t
MIFDRFSFRLEKEIDGILIPKIKDDLGSSNYLQVEKSILVLGLLFKKRTKFYPELFSEILHSTKSKKEIILSSLCWTFSAALKHLIELKKEKEMKTILGFYLFCMKSDNLFEVANTVFLEFCDTLKYTLDQWSLPKFEMTEIFNVLVGKYKVIFNKTLLMESVKKICEYGEIDQNSDIVHSFTVELIESLRYQQNEVIITVLSSLLSLSKFHFYPCMKEIFDLTMKMINNELSTGKFVSVQFLLTIHLNMFKKYGKLVEELTSSNYLEIIKNFHLRKRLEEIRVVANTLLCEIFSYKSEASRQFVDILSFSFSKKKLEDKFDIFQKPEFLDYVFIEYAPYWYHILSKEKSYKEDEMKAFSKLVLRNITYSNEKLFRHDISDIENELQVRLVLDEKYFRLCPNGKLLEDLKFNFE